MSSVFLFAVVFAGTLLSGRVFSAEQKNSSAVCDTVYLLNVVPYPEENAGWDRGFEMIPAAHLAAAHINNRSDILTKISVIDVESEACGRTLVTEGQLGIFENIMRTPCVSGVIGLFCSAVTELVLPQVSHPEYGYVQLSSSTSPLLQNSTAFPYLFRAIHSSEVFNHAVVSLMDAFNWRRISLVHDSKGIYFGSTGNHFATLIKSSNKTLVSNTPILHTEREISNIFEEINEFGGTITYYSVTEEESASIMCEASKRHQLWDEGYVHIFQERTVEDMLNIDTNECKLEEMQSAIEGVLTLQFRLSTTQTSNLISGMSYEVYFQEYLNELHQLANETGIMDLEGNEYANSLYDQVWAFALAMNNSLNELNLVNDSFENAHQTTPELRGILTRELKKVSFDGVTGHIYFGEEQETQTSVDIFQIRNGSAHLIGTFSPYSMNLSFVYDLSKEDFPEDTPEERFYLIPLWLGSLLLAVQGVLLCLLLIDTALIVYLRKTAEIKSSSFYISLIIMLGCYFLCISSALYILFSSVDIDNTELFKTLFYLDLWLSLNGLGLVIIPLLFRLLRIAVVFGSFRTTGKYWSDRYLIAYIFLLSTVVLILLIVWSTIDPLECTPRELYMQPINQPPYYLLYAHCSSHFTQVWLLLIYIWLGVVFFIVVLLGIKTRRIKRKNYKDTKKVNVFVFLVSGILMTFIPLSFILDAINVFIGAFFCKWMAFFMVPLLCQLFIFMPKIFPGLVSLRRKPKTTLSTFARATVSMSFSSNSTKL